MSYSEDKGTACEIIPLGPLQALATPAPKYVLAPGSDNGEEGRMGQRSGHPQSMGLHVHTSPPLRTPHSPKDPRLWSPGPGVAEHLCPHSPVSQEALPG